MFQPDASRQLSPPASKDDRLLENNTRKRKRSVEPKQGPLFEPFSFPTSLPESIQSPITLVPHILLPRARLPLSYLDYGSECTERIASIRFSAKSLDLEWHTKPDPTRGDAVLIIAREQQSRQLYAVERIQRNCYIACPLAVPIRLYQLAKLASDTGHDVPVAARCDPNFQQCRSWWSTATLHPKCQEPSLADDVPLQTVLVRSQTGKPHSDPATATTGHRTLANPQAYPKVLEDSPGLCDTTVDPPLTVEAVCCTVVEQYLDTLYKSKASLAYFAKGPLSRARAVKCLPRVGNDACQSLTGSLRSMVHSTAILDKKYRSKLPELIKSAGHARCTDPAMRKPQKPRKLKKPKPGKDGMYSVEPDFLTAWWEANELLNTSPSTEQVLKYQLTQLQFRESLLQIILILEIMAIEGDVSSKSDIATKTSDGDSKASLELSESQIPARKEKRPQNLESSLDMHIDKVCIWQSVDQTSSQEQAGHNEAAGSGASEPHNAGHGSDKLKEFYIDVLLPFYSARLPKRVKALAKTLGVATKSSPSKLSATSTGKHADHIAPGTEVQRSRPQQRRKPLSRILADSSNRSAARPPSLLRSATDSRLQDIKREDSVSPFEVPQKSSRGSLSRTNSMIARKPGQREVDMSLVSRFHEAKAKRKTATEEELREAIAVLKKPNRALSVKDPMRPVERLNVVGISGRRVTAKKGVEVGVTPRREHKTHNALFGESVPTAPGFAFEQYQSIPSTNPFVPSSATKAPKAASLSASQAVAVKTSYHQHPALFETPSRKVSRKVDVFARTPIYDDVEGVVPQSSIKKQTRHLNTSFDRSPATDIGPQPVSRSSPVPGPSINVGQTPVKVATLQVDKDVDTIPRFETAARPVVQASSIYDTLGWGNDEIDELM